MLSLWLGLLGLKTQLVSRILRILPSMQHHAVLLAKRKVVKEKRWQTEQLSPSHCVPVLAI